ncbi:MAG TPA: isocitrate/isopropylmalate family dehydrogenase [Actinomycetes bacterium]|jgi:3-isopropylmalate dehydrogenase|nr:isocitrate/isopropylmalate family dehydrogenase [Actinomycetes bacterium]
MAERSYAVACLPGDGIGPEVIAEARRAVDAAAARFGFAVEWTDYDLGADRYLRTGEVLPETALKELGEADAILLGAVGRPDVAPGVLERGLLLRLRFELDLYVNLRPVKLYPGVDPVLAGKGPRDVDLEVVRENTEGPYVGAGGVAHRGSLGEAATETSLNTRLGVERCVRYAAARALERGGRLTLVHKTNVLVHSGDLWARVARQVADEAGVELDYCHVDAACLYLVNDPGRFDVIVTDNLFGDILTDLGAAIAGGLGTAASANLNPGRPGGHGGPRGLKSEAPPPKQGDRHSRASALRSSGGPGPSLFEPVHGSAPDIAGSGRANPVAAMLSARLMLDHLGEREAAAALERAVIAVLPGAARYSTEEIGERVAIAVAREASR